MQMEKTIGGSRFFKRFIMNFFKNIVCIFIFCGLVFTGLLLDATSVDAADKYVRDGGTSATCTSWADACDQITTAENIVARGETIWVANGSYGAVTFNVATSGSTYIYVKKAIASSHGTDEGWSSSYGDGKADIASISFGSSFWNIDGQVGQWASDLPNYVAYGIRIRNNSGKLIDIPSATPDYEYITVRHIEASFTNTTGTGAWSNNMDVIFSYGQHTTFEYCWLHDGGRVIAIFMGANYVTFDHCVLERNGQAQRAMGWDPTEHSEIIMFQPGSSYGVVRYSYIRDWDSTGGIILYDRNSNMSFYGNVFTQTGTYTDTNGNGAINGLTAGTGLSAVVYNNTFADLRYGCNVLSMGTYTSRVTKNNIFYNCWRNGNIPDTTIGGTYDYNWYYNSGTESETHIQRGTGDPFVNRAGKNYRLSSGTNAGDTSIGSNYKTDPAGNTRSADGVWDRGAFEFQSGSTPLPDATPAVPTNILIQ